MNLLFVLPSIGYGLYLFVTSGSPTLLVMSAMTFCVWLLVARQRDVDLKAEVSQKDGRVYVGDRRLSWFPWLWGKQVRNLVYESYRSTNEVQIPPAATYLQAILGAIPSRAIKAQSSPFDYWSKWIWKN
ncbi:MAG: hypothetical protein EBS38_01970 [Actinobacteria bacterium]|nr:hypothetical protein [Actinomycetota bacterium]